MPPSKREPACDAAVLRVFRESGDLAVVARHFEATEGEVTAAIFRAIIDAIPRKPPTPANRLWLVPRRSEAA